MRRLVATVILCIPMSVSAEWQAPPNADPTAVFVEAGKDTWAGRHEIALAKYLWLHDQVPDKQTTFFGWITLGKKYPPALQKLKETRDAYARKVATDSDSSDQEFQNLVYINELLGDNDRTASMFVRLDEDFPKTAERLYPWAQPALISAKEFDICGKYLQPERSYSRLAKIYDWTLELAEEEPTLSKKEAWRKDAELRFLNESATLIGLLVLNNRKAEAEELAKNVRQKSKHANRNEALDAALQGKLPALPENSIRESGQVR